MTKTAKKQKKVARELKKAVNKQLNLMAKGRCPRDARQAQRLSATTGILISPVGGQ